MISTTGNTETNIKKIDEIGIFTIPPTEPLPLYDCKAMMDYCREQKSDPLNYWMPFDIVSKLDTANFYYVYSATNAVKVLSNGGFY